MSTDYEFECAVCKQQGGGLTRRPGNRWDADIIGTFKFFVHHLTKCSPTGFEVIPDGDDAYLARPDVDFIPSMAGRVILSEDWDRVAQTDDLIEMDREWSEWMQQCREADAAIDDGDSAG